LNTEQGFREQRQGGGQQPNVLSPTTSISDPAGYNSTAPSYTAPGDQQPQLHQQAQPHPSQQPAYHSARTGQSSHPTAGLASQAQPISSSSRTPYQQQETAHAHVAHQQQQYSPPDAGLQILTSDNPRPPFSARSYSNQQPQQQRETPSSEDSSMSASNNGSLPAPKAVRTGGANRQSVHNGLNSREGSVVSAGQNGGQQGGGVPAFSASVVPPAGQGQAYPGAPQSKGGDVGRITPQPVQTSEDMTEEDINQLIKDHKELRMCRISTQLNCCTNANTRDRREVYQGQEILL
jgi:hypothetical protein